MAYFSFLRRSVVSLLLSSALTACSIDSVAPPASVGSVSRVSSIQSRRVVTTTAPQAQYSYPSSATPVSSASVNYLDTPNLAGVGHLAGSRQPAAVSQPEQQMPAQAVAIAPAAMPGASAAPAKTSRVSSTMTARFGSPVPPEGVNMDAGLGVAEAQPVTGLAQEEEQDIAEGESDEPVVDGIGSDAPVQTNRSAIPRSAVQAQLGRAPTTLQEQQVAMLPRARNPMTTTEPVFVPPVAPPLSPQVPAAMPSSELQCRQELKRLGVIFQDKPPISNGPACQVPYPVSLRGLSGDINVSPAVTLNCQTTLAFAKWVKNELAPAARTRYWSGVGTIVPLGGYSCRRMNNSAQKYNPMSEHAHGNAIDVGKFILKNGHEIDIRKKGLFSFREGALLKAVRYDSCKYFDTVLGPGSNPEHWNHFHFDLRERNGGRRYCD